jgi:glutamate-ammonia-ligase adenylyltransferase
MLVAQEAWKRAGERPDLEQNIDSMMERIRRERGSGSEFRDFKTGRGGIIEGEFLVQTLQMRSKLWQPNWGEAVTGLAEAKCLTTADAAELKEAYHFLRKSESVLRRYENMSVAALPADPGQQLLFARRLGYESLEAFQVRYDAARSALHGIYLAQMKPARLRPDGAGGAAPESGAG